jgi:hypothetical protein
MVLRGRYVNGIIRLCSKEEVRNAARIAVPTRGSWRG